MQVTTLPLFLINASRFLAKSIENSCTDKYFARSGYKIRINFKDVDYIEVYTPDEDDVEELGIGAHWEINYVDSDFNFETDPTATFDIAVVQIIEETVF